MAFHPDSLPDLRGKVFIVTGGNSGMGYYAVARLAEHGAHVYMGARNPNKATEAIASIKKDHPEAKIDFLQMDLMDLNTVVEAANKFLSLETSLHGLVNNAGIMASPFEMTKDGHECQWQTNYLAHWVLTKRLLPLMLQTSKKLSPGSVRVVNISSSGHLGGPKGGINFEDTAMENNGTWERYGQSKLGNILHAKALHKKYGPGSASARNGEGEIWASSIHPGLVDTNLATSVDKNQGIMLTLFSITRKFGLFWPADKASWNSIYCVASPDMKAEQCGQYLEIYHRFGEVRRESAAAKDEQLVDKLEDWTQGVMSKEGWIR